MKIKIYPIVSSLHNENEIKNLTDSFLNSLAEENLEIIVTKNLSDLYNNTDLSLILVQSGGSESEFLHILDNLKPPFYLLSYDSNNSLAASLEILTYLNNIGQKGEVIHGHSDYIKSRIKDLASKNTTTKYNLGVIGKPSDWLISSNVNYEIVKNKFSINLIDIEISELIEIFNSLKESEVTSTTTKTFDVVELFKANKLYFALNKIVEKYNLDGFTIRCFDLISTIKTTACLSLSLFNERGIIATCEGDIPSMISMFIVKKVLNLPSFQANPSKIDVLNDEMILAHCTVPLNMLDSYSLDSHFESRSGVAIRGKIKLGKATIFRINKDFNKSYIEEGEIIKTLDRDDLCRTQIVFKAKNLDKILTSPLGNHELIILGHHKKELEKYLENL